MKIVYLIFLIFLSGNVFAGGSHHNKPDVIVQNNVTNYTQFANKERIALAIAKSQHHFSMSTFNLQGSIGLGSYEGSQAISGALGKRFGDTLINGSIGVEDGSTGVGFGLTVIF